MSFLRSFLFVYFALTIAVSAQVMSVSSSAPTGLDVRLATDSYNYQFFSGDPSQWGHLGQNGYVEYTISANPGMYQLQLYYSNGSATSGTVSALINGIVQGPVSLPTTGKWSAFQMSGKGIVTLPSGKSRLRLAASSIAQPYNLAGITLSPIATAPPSSISVPINTSLNPLLGDAFFVNPYSQAAKNQGLSCSNGQSLSKIAAQPQSVWFGDWNSNPQADVATVMASAKAKGTVPSIVAYNMVNRDCGGYSSGGAPNATAYETWIQGVARGIGSSKAIVILEPDALSQYNTNGCLNLNQKNERLSLFQYAISMFRQNSPNAAVYLDAGPPNGIDARRMAATLGYAGVSQAAGFAVNVSNYETTASSEAYGKQISDQTGGKHFVIDTSRNGVGPTADHEFCNPPNRGLGITPHAVSGGLVDAYLWVQNPGSSDGSCHNHPPAGNFSLEIACTLLQNSAF